MMLGKIGIPEIVIFLAVLSLTAFIAGKALRFAGRTVARLIYVTFAVLFAVWLWNWATPFVAIP
jgi:hypothetical protein